MTERHHSASPRPRARRTRLRSGTVAGTVAVAAFAAGTALGTGVLAADDRPAPGHDRGRSPVAAGPGLLPTGGGPLRAVDSCEELLGEYRERALALVGPWGWQHRWHGPWPLAEDGVVAMRSEAAPGSAGEPSMQEAPPSATGTNVQEGGVDEPDVVKTDGRLLVRLRDGELTTWDVTGDPVQLGALRLTDLRLSGSDGSTASRSWTADAELLLVGDRVVVLGAGVADPGRGEWGEPLGAPVTEVAVVDVASPRSPVLLDRSTIGGRLLEARQHGDVVRLVTTTGLPDLDFVHPGDRRSESSALRENRALVEQTDLSDWLPTTDTGEDRDSLLGCDAVGVPAEDAGLGTLAVTSLTPSDEAPADPVAATGVLSESHTAYASTDRIYVATAPPALGCCWGPAVLREPALDSVEPGPLEPGLVEPRIAAPEGTTQLHSFALEGERTAYVASGEVDGRVADRWSMDEQDGVLRVAVGATSATGNFSSVVTFVEEGDRLVELGRLDGLGVNEDITSVRWFDELAIVVTFRRIDPLHVVDLTDDAAPRLRGELKVPGFSSYLHPLDSDRLLGIGEGPTVPGKPRAGWGAQAGLFDLSDLEDPRQADAHQWAAGTVAGAAQDPRQLTWLPAEQLALTVVWGHGGRFPTIEPGSDPGIEPGIEPGLGRTGTVSVLDLSGDRVVERSVVVEHGDDVTDVRLVALQEEAGEPTRLLLVTGDGVDRFDPRTATVG